VNTIPVILLAFSRIESLKKSLETLDKCSPRKVLISFDGVSHVEPYVAEKQRKTREHAEKWASSSPHDVDILQQKENYGCNFHNRLVLIEASNRFENFFHLEDDVEFRPELIAYIDCKLVESINLGKWGICGFNPSPRAELKYHNFQETIFFKSYSTWSNFGWATNSTNIESLLKLMGTKISEKTLNDSFNHYSNSITKDPALRRSLMKFLDFKAEKALRTYPDWLNHKLRGGAVSWDYWALINVIISRKEVVKPTFSLSREGHYQHEGQEHKHDFPSTSWDEFSKKRIEISSNTNFESANDEILGLKEWNISRTNAWKSLLANQLRSLRLRN
jgi:hypothetical protein